MTPSWGGYELSEAKYRENTILINQVLIQKIN